MSDSKTSDEDCEKRPRMRRVTFASPITPLRISDGGVTSPASSICSSSSSSSVTVPAPLHSILKKSASTSDAQSGSTNSSAAQSGSGDSSAAQSSSSDSSIVQSGSRDSSAAQSVSINSSAAQSVPINSSAAQFRSTNTSVAQSGSIKTSVAQSRSIITSAAQSRSSNTSVAQSRSRNTSGAQSGSSNTSVAQSRSRNTSAAQSGSSNTSGAAQSGSSNTSAAQSSSSTSAIVPYGSTNSSDAQSSSSISAIVPYGSSNSSAAQSGCKSTSATQSSSSRSSGAQSDSSIIPGDKPPSGSNPGGKPPSSIIPVGKPQSSIIPGGKPSSSIIPVGKPPSSIIPGGKPPSSNKGSGQSKSSTSAGVHSGSTSRGGGRSGTTRTGRSSAMHSSTAKPLKSSARSTVTAPVVIRPAGNLFPSGEVKITGMTQGDLPRTKILGSGTHSYGVGNVVPRPMEPKASPVTPDTSTTATIPVLEIMWKQALVYTKPEEVKKAGNEMFKKGCYTEALRLYDRAIELSPHKATYHNNRAAALVGLARIGEALLASEEAVRFDPQYVKAQHRLASLFFRLGQIDNARKHFSRLDQSLDPKLGELLQEVEEHLKKCEEARKVNDWKIVLKEADAAITSGADYSPQLVMCKVEALLKLFRVDEARRVASQVPKLEPNTACLSKSQLFDMICGAYTSFAKSHMELALGRFENAATAAEKAADIDPKSNEVEMWYKRVKSIVSARDRGDILYESERYTEASTAYTESLKFDPSNAVLHYKRAVCYYRVKNWKNSIADCNEAQLYQPRYTQPLVLRAAINFKLERWAEAVKDYAILRRQSPYDKGIAASLFHSQVALKKSRGDQIINMEFRGDVEEICSLEDFKAALTRPGVSIVEFMKDSDQQCKQMSAFMDALCIRYPSLHYLKVEIGRCAEVRRAENVKVVPTFKIYKNGKRVKEMVCSSRQVLEDSVRYYSFFKSSNNKIL